jgi:hypothetical protein
MIQQSGQIHFQLMKSLMQEHEDPFTLYLPEVSPSDWEMMMQYLDSTKCPSREEARRLRPLYVQFGFHEGMQLCEDIIQTPALDPLKIL